MLLVAKADKFVSITWFDVVHCQITKTLLLKSIFIARRRSSVIVIIWWSHFQDDWNEGEPHVESIANGSGRTWSWVTSWPQELLFNFAFPIWTISKLKEMTTIHSKHQLHDIRPLHSIQHFNDLLMTRWNEKQNKKKRKKQKGREKNERKEIKTIMHCEEFHCIILNELTNVLKGNRMCNIPSKNPMYVLTIFLSPSFGYNILRWCIRQCFTFRRNMR